MLEIITDGSVNNGVNNAFELAITALLENCADCFAQIDSYGCTQCEVLPNVAPVIL
jgi:hypothetical protein